MGLLRDEDINDRKAVENAAYVASHPVEIAIKELKSIKDALVLRIVDSARSIYVRTGKLKGVVDLDTPNRNFLIKSAEAEQLIKNWMEEFDPDYEVTVRIGPDCSGNWVSHPELVVEFKRKVAN